LIKASPAVSDARLPPSLLRRSLRRRSPAAFFETPLDLGLLVVFFAIFISRRLSMLNSSARRSIRVNRLAVLTL
jgi:hypothetical protein